MYMKVSINWLTTAVLLISTTTFSAEKVEKKPTSKITRDPAAFSTVQQIVEIDRENTHVYQFTRKVDDTVFVCFLVLGYRGENLDCQKLRNAAPAEGDLPNR
jgi:hypothetical protein